MITVFWMVNRHYRLVQSQIECQDPLDVTKEQPPVVLVPIHAWDKLIAKSLRFAMRMSPDVIGVHLSNLEGDAAKDEASEIRREWARFVEQPARGAGIPPPTLELVRTPYREFITPVIEHIEAVKGRFPDRLVVVLIPEIVERHWWNWFLHTRRAAQLRAALRAREDERVVVIELPWFVKE